MTTRTTKIAEAPFKLLVQLKFSIKCSVSFLFMIKFTRFYWCICLFIAGWLVKLQGTAHYWERAIEVCITRSSVA